VNFVRRWLRLRSANGSVLSQWGGNAFLHFYQTAVASTGSATNSWTSFVDGFVTFGLCSANESVLSQWGVNALFQFLKFFPDPGFDKFSQRVCAQAP